MRRIVKWFLIADLVAVVAIGGWLLFGWKTEYSDASSRRLYRVFGVYTRLALDVSNDGKWDAIAWFPRDEPADITHSEPYRWKEDRDFDGSFDVWVDREKGPEGSTFRWRVDLEHDGRPDWEFVEADSLVAYASIQERRGY